MRFGLQVKRKEYSYCHKQEKKGHPLPALMQSALRWPPVDISSAFTWWVGMVFCLLFLIAANNPGGI